jgi:maltoporin
MQNPVFMLGKDCSVDHRRGLRQWWLNPVTLLLSLFSLFCVQEMNAEPTSTNSEVEMLRKEMQQMREDYEKKIQSLEERLQQVESRTNAVAPSTNVTAAATNAVPSMNERARAFMRLQFNQETETRDWALAREQSGPVRERLQQVLNDFIDITGYFRAGYGRDDEGGPQPAFQAPGAFAKYRLGNEAENYGELAFGKNWYVPDLFSLDSNVRPDGTPSGPIARTQVRLAFYDPYSSLGSAGGFQTSLPEAWASIGNVVASQPTLKFWAGSRFYRRQDIYINDFFFQNMSGNGGGFEDLQLPFGKLALAWIGSGAQAGIYASDIAIAPEPNNQAGFSKQSVDLTLYEVPVPWGKAEFNLVWSGETGGLNSAGQEAPDSQGGALSILHTHEHFLSDDGVNRFSVQVGRGAAKTFTTGFETTVATTNGTFIIPDARDSLRVRLTESFIAQPCENFSFSPALVYQYTTHDPQAALNWFSAGIRPIYHFNRYFSLAFETGADYVVDSTTAGLTGTLWKVSLAPQVSLGGGFLSRPVIRAYVTYAGWSDTLKGAVGGNDFANRNNGVVWGMQMESWW